MKRKIIDIKNISSKEKIILSLTILVLLMFFTKLIQILNSDKNKIDYKNIEGESIFENAIDINDREVYWILNDIISTFINSYKHEMPMVITNDKPIYSREEFYSVLSNDYKKYISKNKFMKISKEMMDKFVINDIKIKEDHYIDEVRQLNKYEYSDNMYLCKLNTVNVDTVSYIGIKLIPNTSEYNIFYLE